MILEEPGFVTIVLRHLPLNPPNGVLHDDASLRDLGLDSMGMVALLLDLEDEYGSPLADDDLIAETFRTVGTLWAACHPARASATGPQWDSEDS